VSVCVRERETYRVCVREGGLDLIVEDGVAVRESAPLSRECVYFVCVCVCVRESARERERKRERERERLRARPDHAGRRGGARKCKRVGVCERERERE